MVHILLAPASMEWVDGGCGMLFLEIKEAAGLNSQYDIPICTQAIFFPVQGTELLMLQPELWLC
jgi:hypothetical protein